ncbi:hypothetical protein GCM10022631_16790 [Deinococcus rubellus]
MAADLALALKQPPRRKFVKYCRAVSMQRLGTGRAQRQGREAEAAGLLSQIKFKITHPHSIKEGPDKLPCPALLI